jgi:hypothetical protein
MNAKDNMTTDNTQCPICGGPISNETWIGHINMGEHAHGHFYKAFCESCRIVVERKIVGKQDTGWLSSSVHEEEIIEELSQQEVAQVEKILAQYPTLSSQWEEFITQKRDTDIVCRFKEKDLSFTGLTIKRERHLIGRFTVFGNL